MLRRFFVVFSGLALVQMLSGCIFSSERPDLAPRHPARYRAGQRRFRAAGARLVARLSLARTDRADRGGADRQSRHRAPPSRASCRPTRRRGSPARRCCRRRFRRLRATRFAADPRRRRERERLTRPALNASYEIDFWGKNRATLRAAQETAVAQPLRPRSGRALDRRRASPTPISRCWLRRTGCGSRASNVDAANAHSRPDPAALRGRHRLAARRRAAGEPGRDRARLDPAARPARCGRTSRRSRC